MNFFSIIIVFFVLGFAIFANGLDGGFIYDDNLVLSHTIFKTPTKFLSFLGEPYFDDVPQAGLYRPFTQISFALNFLVGHKPLGFHLVNIVLHSLNSFLVFFLIFKLFNSRTLSIVTAILFLVLPIHVEAVSSIVGRAELLSFFFGVIAILLWVNKRYLLSGIGLLLALLSKETAIIIPVILILLSVCYRRSYGWLWYQAFAFLIYFLLRLQVLGSNSFGVKAELVFNPLVYASFFSRILTASKVLLVYLQKIFVPYNLAADYSYNQIPVITSSANVVGWLGILILVALIFVVYKFIKHKEKYFLAISVTFFLLPYLVISNLIFPIGTIMGDRLMYLPSLGATLVLGWLFTWVIKRNKFVGFTALVALVIIFSFMTVKQNAVWATEETLMQDAYNKSPNSVITKTNLGVLMLNKNKDLAKQLSLAVYQQYPDHVKNLNLRAALEVLDGNLVEAEEFLERALQLHPRHQGTLENISHVYFSQNKFADAEQTLHELATRYGGTGNVVFYAVVKIQNQKYREALEILNKYFGNNTNETVVAVKEFAESRLSLRKSSRQIEEQFAAVASLFRYSQK